MPEQRGRNADSPAYGHLLLVIVQLEAPIDGPEDTGAGIYVENGNVTCSGCCNIYGNQYGVYVEDEANFAANGNNIYDNWEWGVYRNLGAYGDEPGISMPMLDCEENWWGSVEGPSDACGTLAGQAIRA